MYRRGGFSLIELMIVIAVVAILASIAGPALSKYVQKGRRADAQQVMLDMANDQALWRSSNANYATYAELGSPTISYYNNPVVNGLSATTFNISLTAAGGQAGDEEDGVACTPLTYTLNGSVITKTPVVCWE